MTHRSISSIDGGGDWPPPEHLGDQSYTDQPASSATQTVAFDRLHGHSDVTAVEAGSRRGEVDTAAAASAADGSAAAASAADSSAADSSAPATDETRTAAIPPADATPTVDLDPAVQVRPSAPAPHPAQPASAATATRTTVSPQLRNTGRKAAVAGLFWLGFLLTIVIWWSQTPDRPIEGTTAILLAAGQITGLLTAYGLMTVLVASSRTRWIESWFGAYELHSWRRAFGSALIALVLAHGAFQVLALADKNDRGVLDEIGNMASTMDGMLGAMAAGCVIVIVGVFCLPIVQNHLPYEVGRAMRMALCAALFLAYGHQFATATSVLQSNLARRYWIGLHLVTIAALLWGRVIWPAWFNARHDFRVMHVAEDEAPGWVTVDIGGQRMDWVHGETGQYMYCRFLAEGMWRQSHPFAISAAPDGRRLRIRVQCVGTYTADLPEVEVGTQVHLSEPTGSATPSRRVTDQAMIIASGTGIAPIPALLDELPNGTVVFYDADPESAPYFIEVLRWYAEQRETRLCMVTGTGESQWPTRGLTPTGLKELVPDLAQRDVYVFGPGWLVRQAARTLRWLDVPRAQVHLQSFEY